VQLGKSAEIHEVDYRWVPELVRVERHDFWRDYIPAFCAACHRWLTVRSPSDWFSRDFGSLLPSGHAQNSRSVNGGRELVRR